MIQLRSDKNCVPSTWVHFSCPKNSLDTIPFSLTSGFQNRFLSDVYRICVCIIMPILIMLGMMVILLILGKFRCEEDLLYLFQSKSNQLRNQMALLILGRNWLADTCFKLIFQKQPLRSQLWQTKISQRGVITHRLFIIRSSGHLSQISWGSKWGDKPQWACATTNQLPLYIL